jgi:hypothetical protein
MDLGVLLLAVSLVQFDLASKHTFRVDLALSDAALYQYGLLQLALLDLFDTILELRVRLMESCDGLQQLAFLLRRML